ncbi:MAG: hypothetical protein Q7S14_03060 [bacterium]|nr:hypothetical protein [bacterium]
MKKIEMIWREILDEGIKNFNLPAGRQAFEQKQLAQKFDFSTSTVFAAIKPLRAIGAVEVTGRDFKIINFEKILMFWATHRNLQKDIIFQTHVDLPVHEIEGLVDNQTIYGAYSAARNLLGEAVSDYDKVYVYGGTPRFPKQRGIPNFFILKKDKFMKGKTTSIAQTFVDLWNLSDWFAKDYLEALKAKYYAKFL